MEMLQSQLPALTQQADEGGEGEEDSIQQLVAAKDAEIRETGARLESVRAACRAAQEAQRRLQEARGDAFGIRSPSS